MLNLHLILFQIMELLPFIDSSASDWPIVKISENRDEFVKEIIQESLKKNLSHYLKADDLYDELASTLFQEKIRITEKKWRVDPADEQYFWGNIRKQLLLNPVERNEPELKKHLEKVLESIITRYTEEIAGKFDMSAFKFARNAVEQLFSYMLTTATDRSIKQLTGEKPTLKDRIHFLGNTEKIRHYRASRSSYTGSIQRIREIAGDVWSHHYPRNIPKSTEGVHDSECRRRGN